MGYVSTGALFTERTCHDIPRRQHRGTGTRRSDLSRGEVGRLGESIAALFLERHGLTIIDRNVRVGRGEIDLVADDGGRRVVVEVKTVLAVGPAPPTAEDAFTADKERTVRRLASRLHAPAPRVDLIAISLMESGVRLRWLKSVA